MNKEEYDKIEERAMNTAMQTGLPVTGKWDELTGTWKLKIGEEDATIDDLMAEDDPRYMVAEEKMPTDFFISGKVKQQKVEHEVRDNSIGWHVFTVIIATMAGAFAFGAYLSLDFPWWIVPWLIMCICVYLIVMHMWEIGKKVGHRRGK